MTVYLDCNATTEVDPDVQAAVCRSLAEDYGNAASHTHAFGARAREAAHHARAQVADVVAARVEEVTFTSGATESNNLALLGLAPHGERCGRRHVVTTLIEHASVLEPLAVLETRGFEVTFVPPTPGGWVDPDAVAAAVRPDTLIVSMMHANNETGVVQPVAAVAEWLEGREPYLHVDAAQSFGKIVDDLRHPRIDLVSVSGHKLFAPKGVGALIVRRSSGRKPPLRPLMFGGGHERGLRPGTLPVHLVVGLGLAAETARREAGARAAACRAFRERALTALAPLGPTIHGDLSRAMPHVLNLSFPRVDSEALMVAWRGLIAVSNGAACSSRGHRGSHVLRAMGLPEDAIQGAVRLSWSHRTPALDWTAVTDAARRLR
jgi:cysteine desulfurase